MDKQQESYLLLPINAEKRELITLFGIYKCNSIDFLADMLFALPREKAMTARWPALTKKENILRERKVYLQNNLSIISIDIK